LLGVVSVDTTTAVFSIAVFDRRRRGLKCSCWCRCCCCCCCCRLSFSSFRMHILELLLLKLLRKEGGGRRRSQLLFQMLLPQLLLPANKGKQGSSLERFRLRSVAAAAAAGRVGRVGPPDRPPVRPSTSSIRLLLLLLPLLPRQSCFCELRLTSTTDLLASSRRRRSCTPMGTATSALWKPPGHQDWHRVHQ
jgi:hypothetical protein